MTALTAVAAVEAEQAALWRFMLRAISPESPEAAVLETAGEDFKNQEFAPEGVERMFRAAFAEFERRRALVPE